MIAFLDDIFKIIKKKRENHIEELNALKKIVYYQRCLKYCCKDKYDKNFFIDYENKISAFLKTFFDEELSDCFVKANCNIYWALRFGAEIKDDIIEESLQTFTALCRKKKYNVQ